MLLGEGFQDRLLFDVSTSIHVSGVYSGSYARGAKGAIAPSPTPTPEVPLIFAKLGAILAHFRGIFNEKSEVYAIATLAKKNKSHIFPPKKICPRTDPWLFSAISTS